MARGSKKIASKKTAVTKKKPPAQRARKKPVKSKKIELEVRVEQGRLGQTKKELVSQEADRPAEEKTKKIKIDPKLHYLKVEREKRIIMWSGVAFFMVLFLSIYLFNIKNIFKEQSENSKKNQEFSLNEITDNLNATLEEVKERLSEFNQVVNTATTTNIQATTSPGEKEKEQTALELTEEEIKELKAKLEKLEAETEKQ